MIRLAYHDLMKLMAAKHKVLSRRPAFWVDNVESLAGKCPSRSHNPEAMCLSQSKSRQIRKVNSLKEVRYLGKFHHVNDRQCRLMIEVLAQSIL